MPLIRLTYSEYENDERRWELNDATFSQTNLIVGKNATGKSRLLNVIFSLSQLLTGSRPPFDSGNFHAVLDLNGHEFSYEIACKGQEVVQEALSVDGEKKLTRNKDGSGEIWYEKQNTFLEFKLPNNALAATTRRDEIQHKYLIDLYNWANSVVLYHFGSDFGRSRVINLNDANDFFKNPTQLPFDDPNNLVGLYSAAFINYQEALDKAVIADMEKLGYSLNDVGSEVIPNVKLPFPALGLFTVEKELGFRNPQINMSQGMFRALALSIHLNICAFSKAKSLILIDDIGEGLDFERAVAIIDLLISKARENDLQLIMTSNDRFVMNNVPLEHWGILRRDGGTVKMFNKTNAADQFKKFEFVGLSNFDFFASSFFDPEAPNA